MASLLFNWEDTNGNNPSITYNLYENDVQIVADIAVLNFTLIMDSHASGDYTYEVTAYDNDTKLESLRSDPVTINFTPPAAPAGLSVGWV